MAASPAALTATMAPSGVLSVARQPRLETGAIRSMPIFVSAVFVIAIGSALASLCLTIPTLAVLSIAMGQLLGPGL